MKRQKIFEVFIIADSRYGDGIGEKKTRPPLFSPPGTTDLPYFYMFAVFFCCYVRVFRLLSQPTTIRPTELRRTAPGAGTGEIPLHTLQSS